MKDFSFDPIITYTISSIIPALLILAAALFIEMLLERSTLKGMDLMFCEIEELDQKTLMIPNNQMLQKIIRVH